MHFFRPLLAILAILAIAAAASLPVASSSTAAHTILEVSIKDGVTVEDEAYVKQRVRDWYQTISPNIPEDHFRNAEVCKVYPNKHLGIILYHRTRLTTRLLKQNEYTIVSDYDPQNLVNPLVDVHCPPGTILDQKIELTAGVIKFQRGLSRDDKARRARFVVAYSDCGWKEDIEMVFFKNENDAKPLATKTVKPGQLQSSFTSVHS